MLLASFDINYRKVFELDNNNNNNNNNNKKPAIQRKYKKYSIFAKNADVSKNCEENDFLKIF